MLVAEDEAGALQEDRGDLFLTISAENIESPRYWPLGSRDSGGVGRATYIEKWQNAQKEMTSAIFLLLCLDILMDTEADFIKEIRYLSGLMHQNCHDASWRMERLLSKVEQGESLDTRSTSIQLREARDELQLLMRGIEGIQKLCEELESDDS